MWIADIFAISTITIVNTQKVKMTHAEVLAYEPTDQNGEIEWQIELFDFYDEEEEFKFAVRVPQDGKYCECLRSIANSDWECNAVWTDLPALDYYAAITNVENAPQRNNATAQNERTILILGKVPAKGDGDDGKLIRSSAWHVTWPTAHKKQGYFGKHEASVIKVVKSWRNWPVYYWIVVSVVASLLLIVCISCCVCCCRRN